MAQLLRKHRLRLPLYKMADRREQAAPAAVNHSLFETSKVAPAIKIQQGRNSLVLERLPNSIPCFQSLRSPTIAVVPRCFPRKIDLQHSPLRMEPNSDRPKHTNGETLWDQAMHSLLNAIEGLGMPREHEGRRRTG